MKNECNENYYKSSDLTLATTLSLYFPIVAVEKTDSRRIVFVFNRSLELDKLVERFWRNEITVEPQAFTNQIKNLKTRIYSGE